MPSHPGLWPPTTGAWLSQHGEKRSRKVSPSSAGQEGQGDRVWQLEELQHPVSLPRELGVPRRDICWSSQAGLNQSQASFLSYEDLVSFSSTRAWKRESICHIPQAFQQ